MSDSHEIPRTQARYVDYQNQIFLDADGNLADGERYFDGTVFVFYKGLLDGQGMPGIHCEDSHIEFWKDGVLHRGDGPAVFANYHTVEEWWLHGKRVFPEEPNSE